MGKIEVNEYVRTNAGYIAKLKQYLNYTGTYLFDDFIQEIQEDKYRCISENELEKVIVNHSKIISEVVEKGDYVNGKLIHKIDKGPNYCYLYYGNGKTFVDYQIKTILTHEQFEQNSYKVGGEE